MAFYHNTLCYENTTPAVLSIVRAIITSTSGDGGTMNCHSNLLWLDTAYAGVTILTQFMGGNASSTVTWDGTIGNNVLLFGPNVIASEVPRIYQAPWDTGGTPKATDVVDFDVADTSVFNDPATAYDWVLPNGLTMEIPGDYRPYVYTTAGLGDSVPGALPGIDTEVSGELGEPTHNNLVLEYDFFTNTWTKHVYMMNTGDVFGFNSFLELKRNDETTKLLAACDASGSRQVDTGAVQVLNDCFYENTATQPVEWSASTKYFDCGEPDAIKTFLNVILRVRTPHNISVAYNIDENLLTGTLETVTPTTHTWDEANLNWQGATVETDDLYWGGLYQGDTLLRFPQGVCGRRVSLTFSGSALSEGMEIQGLTIRYKTEERDEL